jgi:hypothetical protein
MPLPTFMLHYESAINVGDITESSTYVRERERKIERKKGERERKKK